MRSISAFLVILSVVVLLPLTASAQFSGGSVWIEADYLHWWVEGTHAPPLVTTSPQGTDQDAAGVLGQPDTTILLGHEPLGEEGRSGTRLTLGMWLDDEGDTALAVTGFGLGDGGGTDFTATTSEYRILARPFFNTRPGVNDEDSELVSFTLPPLLDGRIDVATTSELYSAAPYLRYNLRRGPAGRLDMLAGYRFMRYREGLAISEHLVSTASGGLVQQGTQIVVEDLFRTSNEFHGGELGLLLEHEVGAVSFTWISKLGLGNVHRNLRIDGHTFVTTPGDPTVTSTGGLLALPSNIGNYTNNEIALLPEFNGNMNVALSDYVSLSIGYSLLWLTDTWRMGEQIDRNVDSRQIPGALGAINNPSLAPQPTLAESSMWVQGLSVGLEIFY